LWFYKHQHDNRVRSKLFVACQRWWFQWRFWFVPSVPGYLWEEEEHNPDPWRNPIERNHMGLHLENEVTVVKTAIIISNNPVFFLINRTYRVPVRFEQKNLECCSIKYKNTLFSFLYRAIVLDIQIIKLTICTNVLF